MIDWKQISIPGRSRRDSPASQAARTLAQRATEKAAAKRLERMRRHREALAADIARERAQKEGRLNV